MLNWQCLECGKITDTGLCNCSNGHKTFQPIHTENKPPERIVEPIGLATETQNIVSESVFERLKKISTN